MAHKQDNSPNPFTAKTDIRFQFAEGVQDASIYIFDMQGKVMSLDAIFV